MVTALSRQHGDDARLWAFAICISLLLNAIILGWIGIAAIRSEMAAKLNPPVAAAPPQTIKIFPEMFKIDVPPPPSAPKSVRTSPDQESASPPAARRFIGERNTLATSDRPPDPSAPALPSQSGITPEHYDLPETTESNYQDGKLAGSAAAPAVSPRMPAPLLPPSPRSEAKAAQGATTPDPGLAERPQPAAREKLFQGPNPVDIPVPEADPTEALKTTSETRPKSGATAPPAPSNPAKLPKPTPPPTPISDPAFRGNQSKTALQGSISRTGRSALDVADTPMGRYQSLISRAVELEWQRNCVRHRDFITPGFLTVSFFIDDRGKVKHVRFVGEIQTGEVQKGFTLNSIRDAEIPAMPPAVRKEMGGDSLELIFNFYF